MDRFWCVTAPMIVTFSASASDHKVSLITLALNTTKVSSVLALSASALAVFVFGSNLSFYAIV